MGHDKLTVKSVLFYFLAYVAKGFYLAYLAMCSPKAVITNSKYLPQKLPKGLNVIYVFWHSKTFLIMPYCRNHNIGVLTLMDWKNYFYDRLCTVFGYRTVPVRDASSAARRLAEMLENGYSIALAVDGPQGPTGAIRPGAIYLSQKTKRPIVAINVKYEKSLRIEKRWDKYEIPLPLTRTFFTVSDPIYPAGKNAGEIEAELREKLGIC